MVKNSSLSYLKPMIDAVGCFKALKELNKYKIRDNFSEAGEVIDFIVDFDKAKPVIDELLTDPVEYYQEYARSDSPGSQKEIDISELWSIINTERDIHIVYADFGDKKDFLLNYTRI